MSVLSFFLSLDATDAEPFLFPPLFPSSLSVSKQPRQNLLSKSPKRLELNRRREYLSSSESKKRRLLIPSPPSFVFLVSFSGAPTETATAELPEETSDELET